MNWLVGSNGAGKTSLLEAIYLLSYGHSFRAGGNEALIQRGETEFALCAEIKRKGDIRHVLGMSRDGRGWRLRVDGLDVPTLNALLAHCAVICFEPGSHVVIAGPAEERRRFLDWGVFHVEHGFLEQWRQYKRALRQRNALLRLGGPRDLFALWEAELERFATPIERARRDYFDALKPYVNQIVHHLMPELGSPQLRRYAGWNSEQPLKEALAEQRPRDVLQGHTRSGPHRADWRLSFKGVPDRIHLSRGQTKLVALCCVLAQATLFADIIGEWPILCMDELASELDSAHQLLVFEYLERQPVQTWFTSTDLPHRAVPAVARLFHVEHGVVRPA
jgi:DNA replication and repair protein RecF